MENGRLLRCSGWSGQKHALHPLLLQQFGETEHRLEKGDLFAVPSWVAWSLHADTQLDLFRFNDGPIIDRLKFTRTYVPGERIEEIQ